jgi:membrane-bound lytic murein transglycosylase D
VDERRDPVKATAAATRFLKDLRARFGSLYLAAAAYNGGAGRVGRGLNALGDGEPVEEYSDSSFFRLYDTRLIHRETKDYVPKLIAAATIAKEPARYGFEVTGADEPFAADSVFVSDMTGLDVIARLADTTVAVIRDLNPQYLRLVTPPSTRSIVLVPTGMGERTQLAFNDLPARERVTFREHVVSRGETAGGIARIYRVSLTALYEANPRIRARSLRIGQRLVIPVGGAMSTVVARSVSEPETRSVTFHRVRRGETVSGIARRYGVSQAQLQRWNNLGVSGRINAGQRLRVGQSATERARVATRSSSRTHTVRSGETLSGLAQQYGVRLSALAGANGLTSKSRIRVGQKLEVPTR